MKSLIAVILIFLVGIFSATSFASESSSQHSKDREGQSFFTNHVKEVLNKRCVACHACYDSPCSLNLASIEGIARGLTTSNAYQIRTSSTNPDRLFIDANSDIAWRKKGFYSIFGHDIVEDKDELWDDEFSQDALWSKPIFKKTLNRYTQESSLLYGVLQLKKEYPIVEYTYKNATEFCPVGFFKQLNDLRNVNFKAKPFEQYVINNKHGGMPYGFPKLKYRKKTTDKPEAGDILSIWLSKYNGVLPTPSTEFTLTKEAKKWETLLNINNTDSKTKSFKRALTAKYIYEHLFLAHIRFENDNSNYRLIRSSTQSPAKIQEIATRRPFDSPFTKLPFKTKQAFYYRFKKITSTIVNKTHIVFNLDSNLRISVEDNFFNSDWIKDKKGRFIGYKTTQNRELYEVRRTRNPFDSFAPIPPSARYTFMLRNAEYFIRTFIRGPVCRGQVALNVINDHFWVTFLDPTIDPSIQDESLLYSQRHNLTLPSTRGMLNTLLKFTFPNYFMEHANTFNRNRMKHLSKVRENGLRINDFWSGNDNSLLTIYRHGDNASVMKGLKGEVPKTAWTLDFYSLETIYYNLVVNFDLYSSVARRISTRKFMEISRIFSEDLFLNALPVQLRALMRNYWMRDDSGEVKAQSKQNLIPFISISQDAFTIDNTSPLRITKESNRNAMIDLFSKLTQKMQSEGKNWGKMDSLNCVHNKCWALEPVVNQFEVLARNFRELNQGKDLFSAFPSLSFIQVVDKINKKNTWYTMIKNSGHFNVASMFNEDVRYDTNLDSIEFHKGFIGNYPNLFLSLEKGQEALFFDELEKMMSLTNITAAWSQNPFAIGRFHNDFWKIYDDVNSASKNSTPPETRTNSGIFDLSRYLNVFTRMYTQKKT